MFCTQCGNTLEPQARFCSKCGQATSGAAAASLGGAALPAAVQTKPGHDMAMHINILSWLLIGCGILTAVGGMMLLFVGRLVLRLPASQLPSDMPLGMPPFVSSMMSIISLCLLALAAGVTAAGVGLLQYRSWARIAAIIAAVFLLVHFPLGTVIAIYAFWVLLSQEGQKYYLSRSESTIPASGTT